jgi:hypothetical protein
MREPNAAGDFIPLRGRMIVEVFGTIEAGAGHRGFQRGRRKTSESDGNVPVGSAG